MPLLIEASTNVHGVISGVFQKTSVEIRTETSAGWCFGTMDFYDFPYIGKFIIPTDELHHFSEG